MRVSVKVWIKVINMRMRAGGVDLGLGFSV